MTLEEVLTFVDNLSLVRAGKGINPDQRNIVIMAWEDRSYNNNEKINKSEAYIRQIARNIWKMLNEYFQELDLLGAKEKVRVENVRTLIERYSVRLEDFQEIGLIETKEEQIGIKNPQLVLERYQARKIHLNIPSLINKTSTMTKTELKNNQGKVMFSSINNSSDIETTGSIKLEDPNIPVPVDSPFYIERPRVETKCYKAILEPGQVIRIQGKKKSGKSSLQDRILRVAAQKDYQVLSIDFQFLDSKIWQDFEELLKWVCNELSKKLGVPSQIEKYWNNETHSNKGSCTNYFQDYLLQETNQPIVLVFEKADYLLSHPEVANEFFSLIRKWYEDKLKIKVFAKLRIILTYSETIFISFNNNQSPFNIGVHIYLKEFRQKEIIDLAKCYGFNWRKTEADKIMNLFGGHPHALRNAFNEMIEYQQSLDEFLEQDFTEIEPYKNYLKTSALA